MKSKEIQAGVYAVVRLMAALGAFLATLAAVAEAAVAEGTDPALDVDAAAAYHKAAVYLYAAKTFFHVLYLY